MVLYCASDPLAAWGAAIQSYFTSVNKRKALKHLFSRLLHFACPLYLKVDMQHTQEILLSLYDS